MTPTEMADCCLALVEAGTFHRRQLERVRALLKGLPAELGAPGQERLASLWTRVLRLEAAP